MSSPAEMEQLRCADADRNMVAEVLNTAYADGRITLEEHQDRMAALWEAKTFGELVPLTSDLVAASGTRRAPESPAAPLIVPSPNTGDSDQIMAILSTNKREGVWTLHRQTTVFTLLGEVRLDLTQAVAAGPECVINVTTILGSLRLELPEGVGVIDRTNTVMGEVKLKGLGEQRRDAPVIVLTGAVILGDVVAKGPGRQRRADA